MLGRPPSRPSITRISGLVIDLYEPLARCVHVVAAEQAELDVSLALLKCPEAVVGLADRDRLNVPLSIARHLSGGMALRPGGRDSTAALVLEGIFGRTIGGLLHRHPKVRVLGHAAVADVASGHIAHCRIRRVDPNVSENLRIRLVRRRCRSYPRCADRHHDEDPERDEHPFHAVLPIVAALLWCIHIGYSKTIIYGG